MLELGGAFDEDLFGETRDRRQKKPLASYNAKICLPGWFQDKTKVHIAADRHNVHKYCGDLAYLRANYELAITEYNDSLDTVPANNTALRRDLMENIARCYLGIKDYRQALLYAKQVEELAQNFEHTTSLFNLLSTVYDKLDMQKERLVNLQKAITLHSSNTHLWRELAVTYLNLHLPKKTVQDNSMPVIESAETLEILNTSHSELCSNLDSMKLDHEIVTTGLSIRLVICTCLVRARSLLQSVQRNIVSFAKDQNIKLEKQLLCDISNLAVPKDVYDRCVEHVNIEVFGLESLHQLGCKDDNSFVNQTVIGQTPVDVVLDGFSSNKFEKKWFSWNKPTQV